MNSGSFKLHAEPRSRYLHVRGTGTRDGLTAVFESSIEFSKAVQNANTSFILVDYSNVFTHVSVSDVFNITRLYEKQGPFLSKLCLSIIINPAEIDNEKMWEEICQKRGFRFKIFIDSHEAEKWLLSQIEAAR